MKLSVAALLLFSASAVHANPINCSGTISSGDNGAGIFVQSGKTCTLSGSFTITGDIKVEEKAKLFVQNGVKIEKGIECTKCKVVSITDSPSLGGVKITEGYKGGNLTIRRTKMTGTVEVSKGEKFDVTLDNACGVEPDDMDVIIGELTKGGSTIDISVGRTGHGSSPCFCDGTGLGDLGLEKNEGSITVEGRMGCTLKLDSDTTIKENKDVTVGNIATDGDIEIEKNRDVTLNGSFGLEDVKITTNRHVTAAVRDFGSLAFIENSSVEVTCLSHAQEDGINIEKTSGSVSVTDCNLASLTCKDNNQAPSLAATSCVEDLCDGAAC